jgi:hypothetical protein
MNERYAWLESFITEWSRRPLEPGDGFSEAEIREAEERLGIPFPAALRVWYRRAGKRKDFTRRLLGGQIPMDQLYIRNGMLYFWDWTELEFWYGIGIDALSQPDPPVREIRRNFTGNFSDSTEMAYQLSQFLVDNVAYEIFMGAEYLAMGGEPMYASFWEQYEPIPELSSPWPGKQFYRGADFAVMVFAEDAHIIGKTPEAVDRIVEAVGGPYQFIKTECNP